MSRRLIAILVAVTAAASSAQVVHAQTAKSQIKSSPLAQAVVAHERAVELYADPSRAADAARLHLEEASFRTRDDPQAVDALVMAAHMFFYAKRPFSAKRVMEQAAKRALTIGDVNRAAQAYVDAAFLAQKQNNDFEMQRLGRKALLLTNSPQLQPEQRITILRRIQPNTDLAAVR
jgi:hypothetical protein